jgi:hypothetical protein
MSVIKTGHTTTPASAIGSVHVVHGQHRTVAVTWIAGGRRGRSDVVNLSPLIDTHKFYAPLRKNAELFSTVRAIDDGFAIAWGDGSIDMSAASVERLAEEAMTGADFYEFLKRNALSHQGAAAALGRSKRQIEHYLQYEVLPRMVVLACIGYETRREIEQAGRCPVMLSYSFNAQGTLFGWNLPVSPGALVRKIPDHCD